MRATGFSTPTHPADPTPTAFWLLLLLLAVAVYAWGLGGQYVPTNGDELVYVHIARKTAESGQWLPLASELADTRNTKPPLLFWQAMVAGDWGQHWTMAALRAPSLLYTLLISLAIAYAVRLSTRRWHDGLLAACVYLVFLSTFRYNRPYLTSAPETFWFSLPLFALLWQRIRHPDHGPGWGLHTLLGLGLGLGLAYKSFALIAPSAAAWWLALVLSDAHLTWRRVLNHTLRTGFSALLALGVFALWFALDPNPTAVWREFIVGENASKFSDARGYWQEALSFSGSSIWSQLLAYAVNAGLLAPAVLGLAWLGLRPSGTLRRSTPQQRILLAWAAVWLVVFLIPSQRSARYVIPAMPAVAMLLALHWRAIGRHWFIPTLLLSGLAWLVLGRIAWVSHELGLSSSAELGLTGLAIGLGSAAVVLGFYHPGWTRACAVLAGLTVYATFNLTVAPLDGPIGRYPASNLSQLPAGSIAVPNGFNGQFERFEFLLPGHHRFLPYDTDGRALARARPDQPIPTAAQQLNDLLATHDAVIWAAPALTQTTPACLPTCRIVAQRWHLKSRHLNGEVRLDNLWYPQEWLFRREWLLTRAAGS
mgnify:CR=1 FL=1